MAMGGTGARGMPRWHAGLRLTLAAWLLALLSAPAQAWNDAGHMLIALIAYDELTPVARQEFARVLRAHPRYQEDFLALMPRAVRQDTEAQQQRWLFASAATWPDRARHFNHVRPASARPALVAAHHRARWHYINLPTFLSPQDQQALGPLDINLHYHWTETQDPGDYNLVQALAHNMDRYLLSTATDADKAIALCWLLHLLGDMHQPLHTTALFSAGAFPNGDRGGNSLRVNTSNLHAVWDGALGADRRWPSLLKRLAALQSVPQPAWPEAELRADFPAQFGRWVEAGQAQAQAHIYVPAVLAQVQAVNDRRQSSLSIQLPVDHEAEMTQVAQVQALLAGWRTAWVLESLSNGQHGR